MFCLCTRIDARRSMQHNGVSVIRSSVSGNFFFHRTFTASGHTQMHLPVKRQPRFGTQVDLGIDAPYM